MTKRRNRPTTPEDVRVLLEMLTYCRPHGSRGDLEFRARYLLTLPGTSVDDHRNVRVDVGDSRILWSSHTDTVHRKSGRQCVEYHASTGLAVLPLKSPSNCLGADDTIGVWIMAEMIRAGVPGQYVFHYGEEAGGIGARAYARAGGPSADVAIAFDRAGYGDVVTHQWGGRTCSDSMAGQIADVLRGADDGLRYAGHDGVYTDTAEYADIVSECTNLSVGYRGQHTTAECADLTFARRLRDAVCTADWSVLVPERVPGDSGYVSVVDDPWYASDDARWATSAEGYVPDADLCLWCDEETGGGSVCQFCGEVVTEEDDDYLPLWKQRAIKLVRG